MDTIIAIVIIAAAAIFVISKLRKQLSAKEDGCGCSCDSGGCCQGDSGECSCNK